MPHPFFYVLSMALFFCYKAWTEWLWQTPSGLLSLKYLLSGPLHKTFANTWSRLCKYYSMAVMVWWEDSNHMSQSVPAAITTTTNRRLGNLMVWRLGNSRSRCSLIQFLAHPLTVLLSYYILTWQRARSSLYCVSSYKGINLILRVPPSWSNWLPKVPHLQISLYWEVGLQHINLVGVYKHWFHNTIYSGMSNIGKP